MSDGRSARHIVLKQPLLFVAADRREIEPWVLRWEDAAVSRLPLHWSRAGKWQGRDVVAIANGVGARRAAAGIEAARSVTSSFSGICSIGTGGALDPSLGIGDIVVATAVITRDATRPALDPHGPAAPTGLVHSSPHIVRTRDEKRNLRASGAIIVEMEAAGVAQSARELDVPFYCVRVVSDLADESFFTDFESFLTPDGRFSIPRLALHAMAHPVKGLGELLRLQQRTAIAAKNLGNYLAQCKF